MIADWRRKFALPDSLFLFVQLAPSTQLGDFVALRAAQMVALQLPNVGYAVAVDIGDLSSPMGSIHPRRKQEVGRRLSLEARRIAYGESSLVSTGPVLESVAPGSTPGTLVVSYTKGTAQGLHTAAAADCDKIGSKLCCGESPFQVRAMNGTWVRADFKVQGATVVLGPLDPAVVNASLPIVAHYAYEQWPQCSVYNGEGAPGTGPNGAQPADNKGATGIAGTPWCWDGGAGSSPAQTAHGSPCAV